MDLWTLIGMLGLYNAYKKQLSLMPPGSPPLPMPDIRFHDGKNPDGTPRVLILHWSLEKPFPGE